jgi:hypothetical protein
MTYSLSCTKVFFINISISVELKYAKENEKPPEEPGHNSKWILKERLAFPYSITHILFVSMHLA